MKYQVIKIEKNYVGTYNFENAEPALEMFKIFVEEAKREEELEIPPLAGSPHRYASGIKRRQKCILQAEIQ